MPRFEEHIEQARHNLLFLEYINKSGSDYFDWQVTTCFYIGVHLINAHLSLFNMQYRKHVDVKDAINPRNPKSIQEKSSLPEKEYLAYTKLQSLSRRSRYLVNEKDGSLGDINAALTYDVHLRKALRHIDTMFRFLAKEYKIKISKVQVECPEINSDELCFTQ